MLWTRRRLLLAAAWTILALPVAGQEEAPLAKANGRALMERVYARHHPYPFVYEEQAMVLIDRNGDRDNRRLRRFSRLEDDGSARVLLLFDSPPEVRGVALLGERRSDGTIRQQFYLPAVGERLIDNVRGGEARPASVPYRQENFLGTDFSIEDLTGEILDDYRYERRRDEKIDNVDYFVVEALAPMADDSNPPLRRHFIRKDKLFITRTDHFDELGRLSKRQTYHDLKSVGREMLRANMVLMDNLEESHQTVIKIHRRVFSPDYVPAELFTARWLFANAPAVEPPEEEPLVLPADSDPPPDGEAP